MYIDSLTFDTLKTGIFYQKHSVLCEPTGFLSLFISFLFIKWILLLSIVSLDFEECAHKLIKMDFPESQTVSL